MRRDLVKLLTAARARGWTLSRTRGGHLRLRHPTTGATVVTASTPSCWRAVRNIAADLRRAERRHPSTTAGREPA
jgi:predicted RNA binding protein YcfA (HicA-like mRNA interferase family)